MELVNLINLMSDLYQLTLDLGFNNTNSFVNVLSLLMQPKTRYCINEGKHFVTGAS